MAGYDWGTGNIQRAVEKTGYADFWELYKRNNLPAETKNYVPEILAAIIIANHPTQYGFDDITFDPPVLTDTVTINYSADLRLVSDIVGAPVDELIALNPSLLRLVTPPDTAFDLHLPAGTAALFQDKIAAIPESKRNSWRYHNVTPEDTLASVAHTYSVSVSALAEANQLDETGKLDGVEALVVPVAPSAAPSAHTVYYTTRRGDTLVSVADRFGVSLTQLRRWNKLPSSGIKIDSGRRLHVAEPALVRTQQQPPRKKQNPRRPRSRQHCCARWRNIFRLSQLPIEDILIPCEPHDSLQQANVERQAQRGFREAELAREIALVRAEIIVDSFLFTSFDSFSITVVVRITPHAEIFFPQQQRCETLHGQRQSAGGNRMDEVIKMYAMNDGNPDMEPAEMSADHDEMEEDDEVETSAVLTSSDDDEVVVEEGVIIVEAVPVPNRVPKKAARKAPAKKAVVPVAAKKSPVRKAAKKAAKKVAKKAAKKVPAKKAAKKSAKKTAGAKGGKAAAKKSAAVKRAGKTTKRGKKLAVKKAAKKAPAKKAAAKKAPAKKAAKKAVKKATKKTAKKK